MSYTSKFTHLLGECRRQMNGAVVGSMRYYGVSYGLNYGVSLPTIRELAENEGKDHDYAKYLFQQQVREIQLVSLHVAEPEKIRTNQELDFWATGIINSEIAEEAAFALFQYVDIVCLWLQSDNELLIYTALLSISKSKMLQIGQVNPLITNLIGKDSRLISKAIITLLESYYAVEDNRDAIKNILDTLPTSATSTFVKEEMEWRMECC